MIKPEEKVTRDLLSSVCFSYKASENYEERLKNPEKYSERYEECLGGFDDKGNMIAALNMEPFVMNFDGHNVKMCGIAAVVTLPEARGTGIMTKIFDECLQMMKDNGYIFSTLFPFSYAYYRKFGYELAYEKRRTQLPIDCFRKYPFPKNSVRLWKKEDGFGDLRLVYDEFRKGRNHAIERSDISWERILKDADPYSQLKFTYIHYDANGKPDSYLRFSPKSIPDDYNQIQISELAWTSKAGLHDMFGFIGGLSPQFNKVNWDVPDDLDLGSMFPEGGDVSTKVYTSVMTRILDLPEALKLMKAPVTPSGKVVLDVVDKSMACNTGKYAVSWENGKISVEKTSDTADINTSIETLAQMLIGYVNPETAAYRSDTTIHSGHEAIDALFPKKKLYLWEAF